MIIEQRQIGCRRMGWVVRPVPTIGRALNVPDALSRSRLWPANALRRGKVLLNVV